MPLSFAKAAYQRDKRKRLARQEALLDRLATIEDGLDQLDALLEWWPQKLPALVKKAIPRSLYKQWIFARQRRYEERLAQNYPALTYFVVEHRLAIDGPQAAARLQGPVQQFWDALLSLKGQREVVTTLRLLKFPGVPEEQLGEEDFVFVALRHYVSDGPEGLAVVDEAGEPAAESLESALALGMSVCGSVMIHQNMPMRSQVKDASGQTQWVPQVRFMGISLGMDDWEPMSANALREAHSARLSSGEQLKPAPHFSFGELVKPPLRSGG